MIKLKLMHHVAYVYEILITNKYFVWWFTIFKKKKLWCIENIFLYDKILQNKSVLEVV